MGKKKKARRGRREKRGTNANPVIPCNQRGGIGKKEIGKKKTNPLGYSLYLEFRAERRKREKTNTAFITFGRKKKLKRGGPVLTLIPSYSLTGWPRGGGEKKKETATNSNIPSNTKS